MIKKGVFQIGGALLIFVWKKDYKAITKPMTTTELYKKVCGILKKQGKMPDILDYGLPAYHPVPRNYSAFGFIVAQSGSFKVCLRQRAGFPLSKFTHSYGLCSKCKVLG